LRCWILFFFACRTVVALGVATCAPVIISNTVYCLFFWIMFCFTSFLASWCWLCSFLSIGTLFLCWCCDFYIGDYHQ
jgi:hypothetical protein